MKKDKTLMAATFCIVLGLFFSYVMEMAPSPILLEISDYYGIVGNDSLLNMSVSVVFITIVLGCLVGARVERRTGTGNLFIISMLLITVGCAGSLFAASYAVLLAVRLIYGLGFGLGVQFIGSAIMKYYSPAAREKMNTLNGMFPFFGTVAAFLLGAPLSSALGGVRGSLAVWAIPTALALVLWIFLTKKVSLPDNTAAEADSGSSDERGVYRNLWSRKPIRLLSVTFVCDFICYSYIAVIVPTLFSEAAGFPPDTAGLIAAIAFPACGLLGSLAGGVLISKTGLRKPSLLAGQIGKTAGLYIAVAGCPHSPALLVAGICVFGISNGLWMPALYSVPMDLEGMTPTLSGAAFALMSACGLAMGFFAPTVGGLITNALMGASGIAEVTASHVFGLKWSLFIFGAMNIVSVVCMLLFRETGKRKF